MENMTFEQAMNRLEDIVKQLEDNTVSLDNSVELFQEGIQLSKKGVLVTAFGANPDGNGDVLRVWEQAGDDGKCVITLPDCGYRTARYCDLRGEHQGKAFSVKKNKITVKLKAYQPLSLILEK